MGWWSPAVGGTAPGSSHASPPAWPLPAGREPPEARRLAGTDCRRIGTAASRAPPRLRLDHPPPPDGLDVAIAVTRTAVVVGVLVAAVVLRDSRGRAGCRRLGSGGRAGRGWCGGGGGVICRVSAVSTAGGTRSVARAPAGGDCQRHAYGSGCEQCRPLLCGFRRHRHQTLPSPSLGPPLLSASRSPPLCCGIPPWMT